MSNGIAQSNRSYQCSLSVIPESARKSEDRHHRITDKLFQRATVAGNESTSMIVILGHQSADIFRIEIFAERCRTSHISKEDGNNSSFLALYHRRILSLSSKYAFS